MCIDCSEVKRCKVCPATQTNEHNYPDGRRWQCCGTLVNAEEPKTPVATRKPTRSKNV